MRKRNIRVFSTQNFRYKRVVPYHVRPVIEGGNDTLIEYVGLYSEHDYVYPRGHKRKGIPGISLPHKPLGIKLIEESFVHQLNDNQRGLLADSLFAYMGEKFSTEKTEKMKKELDEIVVLERQLEREMPGYRPD